LPSTPPPPRPQSHLENLPLDTRGYDDYELAHAKETGISSMLCSGDHEAVLQRLHDNMVRPVGGGGRRKGGGGAGGVQVPEPVDARASPSSLPCSPTPPRIPQTREGQQW
jgi:hypothetical protein